MQMIADGKIKDGTRIIHDDEEYLYDKRFNTLGIVGGHEDITEMLTFNELLNDDFVILEDTREEIEELKNRILDMNELEEYILDYHSKINELVRAVNKLNNTTYKAENCMTD